ncbi:hypothetical protein ACM39_04185 [Chryseobacterium sp. FH2]|nr:hypothetical protein ACM39_04185 [Chryseobacterium sp. FH2]
MHFYIGFFLPNLMKMNVKIRLKYFLTVFFVAFLCSCEKKYQRPDEYNVDLFKDERQENTAYVMSEAEAYDKSDMVLSSSDIKLIDSSSGRGKSFFIYKITSGSVRKTTRDSVVAFPIEILSTQKLKLKQDSSYIFLEKLKGFRFIAEEKKIKYQWVSAAPVYPVKKESK